MEVQMSPLERYIRGKIQHYDHERYWKYREIVIDPARGNRIGDMLRLLYIKRCDAFNNATTGTHRNFGAGFESPPHLPHGLYGIIVSHNAVIGKNAVIFHNVTIGEGKGGAPQIGDNAYIGAGAIIIGKVRIGNNVKIGAGCVVTHDVPDNATVVSELPRVIVRGE